MDYKARISNFINAESVEIGDKDAVVICFDIGEPRLLNLLITGKQAGELLKDLQKILVNIKKEDGEREDGIPGIEE